MKTILSLFLTVICAAPFAGECASPQKTFVNSLDMKFVPVVGTDVLFCIWETRKGDFEVFANETKHTVGNMLSCTHAMVPGGISYFEQGKGKNWQDTGHKQNGRHPVVGVSRVDAEKFCSWLTEKERKEKVIGANDRYRLPTSREWDAAVGLPPSNNLTPKEVMNLGKKKKPESWIYPWGSHFPPTSLDGNYWDQQSVNAKLHPDFKNPDGVWNSTKRDDGYAHTALVGSYRANKYGIYDLGGNVCEWISGNFDKLNPKMGCLRGSSWQGSWRGNHTSGNAFEKPIDRREDIIGFRCVLERGSK